jgi:hypothetical protein|tara:strand:- start:794 stop:2290 length:1497 start_codon:yes stop_codon:yes gene_type:complete
MAQSFVAGGNLNAIAGPTQQTLANNYLDFATGWAQQYLPELYEAEVERYGNRMLSGFLSMVGAEEAMAADQVVWSEQGRLHLAATTVASAAIAADDITFASAADANMFRVNDTVLLYCTVDGTTASNVGTTIKCLVTDAADSVKRTVIPYTQPTLDSTASGAVTYTTASVFRVMVYGSEYAKGSTLGTDRTTLTPTFKSFSNKPIILRDRFQVNGSDVSQIGWVEVTGEEGQNGYMWYLKAEGDTRARFNDYMEMSMLESVRATGTQLDTLLGTGGSGEAEAGTEGLFAAIEDRGHVSLDTFNTANNATTNHADMTAIDAIVAKLDFEGSIEENMLYLDRTETLAIDNMLSFVGAGVGAANVGYGLFDNSSDMALNLGFSGFRRGSYDFYKTDWKYLNDKMAYGSIASLSPGFSKISGLLVPAGVTTVYDQTMGKNMKRPFLHIRYRASNTDNRRLKTWVTGSVGGNVTSDLDAMEVNYLSERCLISQATNNFMLLKR